jgi:putative oxidoreductase
MRIIFRPGNKCYAKTFISPFNLQGLQKRTPKNSCNFVVVLFILHLKRRYMNLVQRFEHWGDTHHPIWVDIIRMALGIFLCYRGYQFLQNMGDMQELMSSTMSFSSFALVLIGHYIVFAHLMGGFLLAIGLLTRLACLVQIPILLGAILFINISGAIMQPYSELIVSVIVLVLLVYFMIAGNGPLSFEKFIDSENQKAERRR